MVETFTPAVCGSRSRTRLAVVVFAAGAIASAAVLGALLGLAGGVLGARQAVLAAAALALAAAAREAGFVRLPLPQARRQVPERWRAELPLPIWAAGYGAGLGAGVFTYQPVSTFWVAGAAAVALGRPLPAAACFSLYGAGRVLTLVWPRGRSDGGAEAAERLAGRRPALLRTNAAALTACGVLLAFAPAAQGARVTSGLDPTVSGGVLAWGRQDGSVVVRPSAGSDRSYSGAAEPSVDGEYLAYRDANGIRIVRWQVDETVARLNGAVSLPALDWPLIAFVRRDATRQHVVVRNLQTGSHRAYGSAPVSADLGRPSLRHGKLAWHMGTRGSSRVNLVVLSAGRRRIVARSKVNQLCNPAVYGSRILWVEGRSGSSALKLGWTGGGPVRTLARIYGRNLGYWTTALGSGVAYTTRWTLTTRAAAVHRRRF
jgi:hypothetical protein